MPVSAASLTAGLGLTGSARVEAEMRISQAAAHHFMRPGGPAYGGVPIMVNGDLHITTDEGAVQLRPVKPCPRCPIPNIDPLTALCSADVGDTLQAYRQNPHLGGAVTFGVNAIVVDGVDRLLRLGQRVSARLRFG